MSPDTAERPPRDVREPLGSAFVQAGLPFGSAPSQPSTLIFYAPVCASGPFRRHPRGAFQASGRVRSFPGAPTICHRRPDGTFLPLSDGLSSQPLALGHQFYKNRLSVCSVHGVGAQSTFHIASSLLFLSIPFRSDSWLVIQQTCPSPHNVQVPEILKKIRHDSGQSLGH